jgi:hypothetical protein
MKELYWYLRKKDQAVFKKFTVRDTVLLEGTDVRFP